MRYRGAMLATAVFATPLAAALLAMPQAAMAQPVQGLYLGGGAGLLLPEDPRITPLGPGFGTGKPKLEENDGYDVVGAVGYGIGNGMRFEIEGDFNRAGIRHLENTPFPTATSGHVRTYGVMANALYDMDVGVPYFYPYVGLGAGYQWTNLNMASAEPGGPFGYSTDSRSGAFAWQAIVGASLPIPGVPGLSGTVDYRFMDILGGEKFAGSEVDGGPPFASALKLHNQFDHSIVFGIRYAFNTPAPAPAPAPAPVPVAAPAPAPARSYLVFFDWDKSSLTDRARSIIKEAADNSTHVQYTRIDVNGYTDTSGTPQYNQGLSIRRAQAVAGELVRDGVPQNAITAQGFGDTHLLVPTGAGVREPQNRRVEIIIH
jgi:outer membrane protein OmpA-like peptidoglycan-associated protein/opacity protein-like surface antigen